MKHAFLAAILLLCLPMFAALSDYNFEQSTATYTPITNPTVIHSTGVDDAMSAVLEIGFSFGYDDVVYTQFKANSNGFITLNPASSASLSNNLTTQLLILGALWDDLKTDDTDAHVAYELTGTSPNQVLTVEYKNLKWYYSVSPVNLVNFQIKLYQGSNRIEFVYGTMGTAPGTTASASIGLSGAVAGNYLSVTPASPTASVSSTTEFNAINGTHVPFLTGNKYSFIPVPPPANDLAATALVGNLTPSMNAPTNYTVTIYNRGTSAQSTYTVQLINASNEVLASAPGPNIAAGATIQVQVSWTPTQEGPVALRGKVVLAGDQYANNDISPVLNVSVMPTGIVAITIGDGSQTARMPFDFFYRNSLNETLYFPAEIGMYGNVTAITLYNQFTTATLTNMPVKIWMGMTDLADLSGGWIPSTQLTQVYDGTVNFPAGQNAILIPLQTMFSYTGGNLVIMFNRPLDTTYYSSSDMFKCQTVGTNRARNVFADSTTYDPANPGTAGTVTGQFPQTTLHMTPLSPDPLFSISPPSKNFGTVLMDTVHNQTFSVLNAGGGTLGINSITIDGSPFFTLQNLPTLPASLTTGQTITFVGRYNPTAAGNHTATITITDSRGNRLTHTVALSGNCIDTTINSLPYAQNFDGVTAPTLPIDWSSLIQPASTSAVVATIASAPFSAPNCARIYNGTTTGVDVLLVAPPLSPSIAINTTRLRLMVKGVGATYSLSVGVMTDPLDATTYTQVQSFLTPTTWTEFVIPFNGYAGTGRYIAIKHGFLGTGQTIYVDDANIELIATNDLAATALSGNTTPSAGSSTTYTASIFNWGTVTQSDYTVKLFNSSNVELATAPGVSCAPGATAQIPLTWTPTAEGPATLYAKVFLTGDQNSANDQSPNLNITVMPTGMIIMTIGDGSQTARMPFDFYYRNSLYETLYYPAEIGMFGNITAISLYNQFVTTTLTNMPVKIWMGTTPLTDLSAGWIPSTDMTLVYDGTVAFPSGTNTIMIPLQTMFTYSGNNLVVLFNRPMDTTYYSSSDVFKCQTAGTNRARNVWSDSTVYDPAAPGAVGTVTGQFPMTTLHMTPLSPDPIFSVTPPSKDFGTVLLDSVNNQTFSVMNAGGGTLVVNSITIAGSPFFTLENMPPLPASLTTGQSITFVGRYSPTAAGTHNATITITDNRGNRSEVTFGSRENQNRLPHTVALTGTCIDATIAALPYAQNFDGVTAPVLPIGWTGLVQPASSTAVIATYASAPNSAPNCLRLYNGSTANTETILIAPPLATTIPANTVRVKVWIKGGATTYTMAIGVMTDPANPGSFTQLHSITPTTAWAEYVVGLNGYTGTGRYIAFRHGILGTGQNIYLDDISFEVIGANDLGATVVTGPATPTAGTAATYQIGVLNWGTNPQSTYTVKLFDSANVELASATGLAVNPGQTVQVPVQWTPAAAGAITIYGKVILTGDQNAGNDQTPNFNVLVNPSGVFTLTIGDGIQNARMPLDFYWKNSLYQTMYYPTEMGNFMGQITGVQFYNNFLTNNPNGATKIWIGTTTQTEFAANGWIPSTELTLVFDGVVTYPSGQNVITIPFNAPYMYLNGENLVMMVNRPMDAVYYSSTDYFTCQTVGTARALNIYSDSTTYDPAAPPTTGATLTGQFPQTTFMVIPGGVGHLSGTVLGAGNQPLAGVQVQVQNSTYAATTNAQGQFQIQNILPGNYTANFSKYGYQDLSQPFAVVEDETTNLNVTMSTLPVVTVSGTVLASDTGAGINGAAIHLAGYADYNANTTGTGAFTIPNVYANNAYSYSIIAPGYTAATGTINVGAGNHSMGTITLNEVAYAPHTVVAAANTQGTSVDLTWSAPDANATEITESFENDFLPQNWTQTITNTGPVNTSGVYPTWCRFGAITISGQPATPTDGNYQAGLWWAYTHQDEWLITPGFNCPPAGSLVFDSYVFLGSTNLDHYYVKISPDNGNTWTTLWDASAQTGGWNYYASPITIDLSAYSGMQVQLAFNAVDGPGNDGLWYVWFIDNIYIGNNPGTAGYAGEAIRFAGSDLTYRSAANPGLLSAPVATTHPSRAVENGGRKSEPRLPLPSEIRTTEPTRSLTGYKVWRLTQGNEGNETSWTLLTPTTITALTLTDPAWQTLPNGTYRWAVKAVYTNNVLSVPSFSNLLQKIQQTGMIAGVVRRANNSPIQGATITAAGYTATTNTAGAYTLVLPVGTYDVTCTAAGFAPQTANGIVVNVNQTTTVNFIMTVDNDDQVIPVTETALQGNYPNPFNPETTISYSLLDASPVTLEIFNAKGQRVRVLVREAQTSGRYSVVWNGCDDSGKPVSSGVYMYRLTAGAYRSSRKMILMQ